MRLKYKGSLNGTGPVLKVFQVADNQTIYAGDVVVLSSGQAAIAAEGAAAGTVIGVSNTDITTTTAAATDVIKVDVNPASIYEAPYDGALTSVLVGDALDMHTAAYKVDATDEDGGYFQVVPQPDGSVANTTAGTIDVLLKGRLYGMA
jgi:hypothetical protein